MTRTKITIALVLVSVLAVGGLAQAANPGHRPRLTLSATDSGKKILATGVYTPDAKVQCPAGGKTVWLLGATVASGTTDSQGAYSFRTSKLYGPKNYVVYAHVNGVMGGPYGNTVICKDVDSPEVKVFIK